jgi:hypothetical protein
MGYLEEYFQPTLPSRMQGIFSQRHRTRNKTTGSIVKNKKQNYGGNIKMGKKTKMEVPLQDEAMQEVSRGMMYASLAITDNKEGTLKKVGRANPWHIEALRMITGSEEQAHKPLETILDEDMDGLVLDWEIDVSGITKGGHFLDTQGYIAHNDEYIVLAFRCTTSAFDWLTNFNTTSSAWELEEDLEQGYSGICSGFDGLCCNIGEYKPRVHTGFYNNFLAALPFIKRHIDPLLQSHERPRKLYVVGHSLGAGIATLAACYFLTEFDWNVLPQSLVIQTAGSPRACCQSMKDVIDKKRKGFGQKTRMYRVVKGKDVVVTVPPKLFGFRHLIDPIFITDGGQIVLKTKEEDPETDLLELTKYRDGEEMVENYDYSDDEEFKTKYDRMAARIPKAFRDHMPDFYLKPMLKARGMKYGSVRPCLSQDSTFEEEEEYKSKAEHAKERSYPTGEQTERAAQEQLRKKPNRTWVPRSMALRRNKKDKVGPTYW